MFLFNFQIAWLFLLEHMQFTFLEYFYFNKNIDIINWLNLGQYSEDNF